MSLTGPLFSLGHDEDGQDKALEVRMLELRLFHHFVTESQTFDYPGKSFVEANMRALALQCPCLMDAALAIAATRLRRQHPGDPSIVAASHAYMARSISQQTTRLRSGISKSNFELLYMTSILIGSHSIVHRQFAVEDAKSLAGVVQWFRAFRGVRAITHAAPTYFAESGLANAFPPGGWQYPSVGDDVPEDRSLVLSGLSFVLDDFYSSSSQDTRAGTTSTAFEAYHHALAYISHIYRSPSRAAHTTFLLEARPAFVHGVEKCDPTALVIVGIYLALAVLVEPVPDMDAAAQKDLELIMRSLPTNYGVILFRALLVVAR
jgi:hypothetical protein